MPINRKSEYQLTDGYVNPSRMLNCAEPEIGSMALTVISGAEPGILPETVDCFCGVWSINLFPAVDAA